MEVSIDGTVAWVIVDYDPGQPYPSYSCGGVPPSWDIDISDFGLDDAEEFNGSPTWALLCEAAAWSEGLCQMLEAFHRLMGRLHPKVEEQALDILTDQIQEKAVEAFHDREPDWEDYRD